MCTARSPKGYVYMSERIDDINLQGNLDMLKISKRGKLATRNEAMLTGGVTTR